MLANEGRNTGLPPVGTRAFRSRFLGLPGDVTRIVLTPVGLFVTALADGAPAASIWPSHQVRGVPLVRGPQGRAIVDCIFNLPAGCEVVFLGLAGGLRDPARVGTWAGVARAWNGRAWHYPSLPLPPDIPAVSGATFGSLTESWIATASAHRQAQVADMETSHIYEIAHRCGVRAVSLVLVSDEPPGMPFWETDLSSLARHISNVPGFLCRWLDHGSF